MHGGFPWHDVSEQPGPDRAYHSAPALSFRPEKLWKLVTNRLLL
jgi:hypothetical protein